MIISKDLADSEKSIDGIQINCFYLISFISLFADPENVSVCSFACSTFIF